MDTYVFANSTTGKPRDNIRKSWAAFLKEAQIKNFCWHDIRHHFTSRLVKLGVDLNTVRQQFCKTKWF